MALAPDASTIDKHTSIIDTLASGHHISAGYEENAHQRPDTGASKLRAANSSTALTCSRVTGNCSITSSMVIPSSKFSKTTATGVRVPLNTQAPLTLPGMLSTTAHWDQSSAAMIDSFRWGL